MQLLTDSGYILSIAVHLIAPTYGGLRHFRSIYDAAVIFLIMSCHKKSYDHTCNNILVGMCNFFENDHFLLKSRSF